MLDPIETEKKEIQIEPARQDRQRLCGTFVLRQGMEAMSEKDRADFLESLEMAGLLRSI
jgi:hypothetical protein